MVEKEAQEAECRPMPKPSLDTAVVSAVVELLLGEWSPAQIVDNWNHDDLRCPSLGAVQRIAKAEGLARKKGGTAGRKSPGSGGGRPSGRPGKKWSRHRDEVRRLREEGHSLRTIAAMVGLKSPQQVSNLLDDKTDS